MLNYLYNTGFYLFSPLDQFGDDDSFVGLLDNALLDLLPSMWYLDDLVDFTGFGELDGIAD